MRPPTRPRCAAWSPAPPATSAAGWYPSCSTPATRSAALARTPQKLRDHPWADRVEVVRGDVTDAESLAEAMRDVDVAYYLVHALGSGSDFEETDRQAARNFGEKARAAGVRRIVYLGGLTPAGVPEKELSPHLRSRAEVGRILLDSRVPTAVLRAAVDHRLGVGLVRDAALSDRAAAGDGDPELGPHPDPAHRRPGRAAVPGGQRHAAARREPDLRHRRPGRPDVPGDDAGLRRGSRGCRGG